MSFWVYWYRPQRRVGIHRADCPSAREGWGLHYGNTRLKKLPPRDGWEEAASYEAAREVGEKFKQEWRGYGVVLDCERCQPW